MRAWALTGVCLLAHAAWADDLRRVEPFIPLISFGTANLLGHKPRLTTNVDGWSLTGSRPDAYQVRCDDVFSTCSIPILRTRGDVREPLGMGSLTHVEGATRWRGMRLRVRAELKVGRVDGWAGLWMRVDGPRGEALAFDNMQDRPLRGTSVFAWYSVVLDVPQEAERLSFGVLLHGPGAVFIRELQLDAVDDSVPTTDLVALLRARAALPGDRAAVSQPSGGSSLEAR